MYKENPRLSTRPSCRGYPAYLDGYVRVFGFDSPPMSWGGGSVASVAPKAGGRVYGCFYLMTPREVRSPKDSLLTHLNLSDAESRRVDV